jgi:PAS domain S-box-containing protein
MSPEGRATALAHLGFLLSSATEPVEAARFVIDASLKFFDWDAAFLHLYNPETDTMSELINMDTIDGHRISVPAVLQDQPPSPLLRKIMSHGGARLILRHEHEEEPATIRFGDTARLSMSLMFVPVRIEHQCVGAMSVQSYRPDAYTGDDLELLQGLADHVAGALARLQAESTTRELSRRLFYHVDNSPLAVIEWGKNMRLIRWSAGAERIFGWTAEEVLGKRSEEFRLVYEEDLPKVRTVADGLEGGTTPRSFSANRNYHKNGAVIYCEWYNSALLDEDGKLRSILSLVLDVTERKRAEAGWRAAQAQLEMHAQELEQTVARRTATLHETIADLEHFSYALTHDMRAPLRAMQSYAQLLENECNECGAESLLTYCHKIKQGAARLDQLIRDSLQYCDTIRKSPPHESVNLHALIAGLIDSYPNLNEARNHIRIIKQLPIVIGNEAGLIQCFSNLLGNAIKFVPAGTDPSVTIRAEPHGTVVRVWVEDQGIGIAKAAQPRIFDMFQRATQGYEGTGIGLAVVKKVIQKMGGEVGVESEEGQGSRFWVELQAPEYTGRGD